MKLALKLVVVCLVAMVLITSFSSFWIARREYLQVRKTHQSNAERIAGLIRESLDLVYNRDGHQGIVNIIKTHAVDSGEMQYRWVWFDVSTTDANHPSAPSQSLERFAQGEVGSVVIRREGPDLLSTYYPMDVNDRTEGKPRKGAVEVSGSLQTAEQEAWHDTKTGLFAMSAMAVFCLAFIAWAGIRFIGRPLEKLTEQTRLIGRGVYDQPLNFKFRNEFGELAVALNEMSDQITAQQQRITDETAVRISTMEQLRHADRLKTVGRLAAGVAHEAGTPLNVISGRADLICSGQLNPQEINDSAAAIRSESDRITGLVRQLMDFARDNPLKSTTVDLRILIERTIELLQTMADKKNVTIQTSLPGRKPLMAFVDESQIQQVLTNLIVNAIHAVGANGQIEIAVDNVEDNQWIDVQIRDNGPGMEQDTLDQIFEPFFTTKDVGQGTGLGLSIAHGIVMEHGGDITVESQLGSGTTFKILLPRSQPV